MDDSTKLFEEAEDLTPSQLFDQAEDHAPINVEQPSLLNRIMTNIGNTTEKYLPSADTSNKVANYLSDSVLDASRAIGQGYAIGAADEIGGAISAIAERPASYLRDIFNGVPSDLAGLPESSELSDRYRQNQQEIQKEFEKSNDRSPVLSLAGQVAGGMTSGSAIGSLLGVGQKAANVKSLAEIAKNEGKLKALLELGIRGGKSYAKASPGIALESALSSKEGGLLNEQERSKLLEDTVGGLMFGGLTSAGLEVATEVAKPLAKEASKNIKGSLSDFIADTPLARQMKVSYEYGKKGINPKGQKFTLDTDVNNNFNLSQLDNQRTEKLVKEIQDAEKRIGKNVGDSLKKAEINGKIVNLEPDTLQTLNQVSSIAAKYPELASNPRAGQIFGKIANGGKVVTPTEAKDLIDYMDSYIGKFESATNITPAERGILASLKESRQRFSNTLKIAIPEYGVAAERFNQFRHLVPETIIAGSTPVGVEGKRVADMNNYDIKLYTQLKRLNQGTTREGSATQPIREAYVNTIKGLKTFEQQEADRLAKGLITENDSAFARTAQDIADEIKTNSDDAVARNSIDSLDPQTGVLKTFGSIITPLGETGRATSLSAANFAGRMGGMTKKIQQSPTNPISKVAYSIYNVPHEATLSLSQKLKSIPELSRYGVDLESALNFPDQNRKNQVLFTIMQNPKARAFVKDENEIQTEEP
jgi:hypothetical protein